MAAPITDDTRDSMWYAGKTGELSGGMTIIGIRLDTLIEFHADKMSDYVKRDLEELQAIVNTYREGMKN